MADHNPTSMSEDKKKVKIIQPKAADPGFGFFLATQDDSAFDSRLNITIKITDDTVNPNDPTVYTTKIEVTNRVYESTLPIIAPFGDQNWLNPSIMMKPLPFEVQVEFLDAAVPYTDIASGEVEVKQGVFEIDIKPIAGPQAAFHFFAKGFRALFGLD